MKTGILAALYALLTVLPPFNSLSYGPIQVRVSEALTVLPFYFGWAPWGLYIGCVVANLGSPFLLYDLAFGASATLIATFMTSRVEKPFLAPAPPVILNSFVVSLYVAKLSNLAFWPVFFYIALGEILACYGLGYPLLIYLKKQKQLFRLMDE